MEGHDDGLARRTVLMSAGVGLVAGRISNFKLIPLPPAAGTAAISGAGLAVRVCSNETPMDFSPGLARNARLRRGAAGYAWASPLPVLRRVTTPASPERHAFAKWRSPVCLPKCRSTIAR